MDASSIKIKVVGVGNGGNSALNVVIDDEKNTDVEFIGVIRSELDLSKAAKKIILVRQPLGLNEPQPARAEQFARQYRDEIIEALDGADVVILVACLGGEAGTGATPVIAEYARELGALTLAVVTCPFSFEGSGRCRRGKEGLAKLEPRTDMTVVISLDNFLKTLDGKTPMTKVFGIVDLTIKRCVESLLKFF